MNRIKTALAVAILASQLLRGESPVSEGQKTLLQKMASSPQAYRLGLEELQRSLPSLTKKEDLYSWILNLDALEKQGDAHHLPFESTHLREVAYDLTRSAAPFVRFDTDDWTLIQIFLRWSDDKSRQLVARRQVAYAKQAKRKLAVQRWLDRVLIATRTLEAYGSPVAGDLAEAESEILLKILDEPSNSEQAYTAEEKSQALEKIRSQIAVQQALLWLHDSVLRAKEVKRLKEILDWTLIIGSALRKEDKDSEKGEHPLHIRTYPSDIAIDALSKYLKKGGRDLSPALADRIVSLLTPGKYEALGAILCERYREKSLPPELVPFLHRLATGLWKAQDEDGLMEASKDFRFFVEKTYFAALQKARGIEGLYRIEPDPHRSSLERVEGYLTINADENGGLLMGLSRHARGVPVNHSFMHVSYSLEAHRIEGRKYNAERESLRYAPGNALNESIRLVVTENQKPGSLVLVGDWKGSSYFLATRVQEFPLPPATDPGPVPRSWSAVYEGRAGNKSVRIEFSEIGDEASATFIFDGHRPGVALPYGTYDRSTGRLTLTSGPDETTGSYVQFRGNLVTGGKFIKGYYVIGGKGIAFEVRASCLTQIDQPHSRI